MCPYLLLGPATRRLDSPVFFSLLSLSRHHPQLMSLTTSDISKDLISERKAGPHGAFIVVTNPPMFLCAFAAIFHLHLGCLLRKLLCLRLPAPNLILQAAYSPCVDPGVTERGFRQSEWGLDSN